MCMLFSFFSVMAQKKKIENVYIPQSAESCSEKLVFQDGKILFFRNTPMSLLKGYEKVFEKVPNVIYLASDPTKRVYWCRWMVENNQMYLEKYYIQRIEEEVNSQETDKEIEDFIGQKFDKKGRIKADWVTGKFPLFGVQPYLYGDGRWSVKDRAEKEKIHIDSLANHQKCFLATFKKGKLLKIEEADKDWKVLKK